jgi:hypothetical protein
VLVAGGWGLGHRTAELYDPISGTWTMTGNLSEPRENHTATLLPNNKVLIVGGADHSDEYLASADLYDPAIGSWSPTGSLATGRILQTQTLLPNGQVLVAGGVQVGATLASAELYDPANGNWTTTRDLANARYIHAATLLTTGKVLIAGGIGKTGFNLTSAELYDVGLGFDTATQPTITRTRFSPKAHRLQLIGSKFQGLSQASGGNSNQDSSTNYPVVQLRAIGNEQVSYFVTDPNRGWSDTSFNSLPPQVYVSGPALVTVFTNGIPSESKYLVVP